MRSKAHRLTALLCAFCMLFASIPSSVLSDSIEEDTQVSVATSTDLQPAGTDEIIPNTDAEPETQDSAQETTIPESPEPDTGTQSTSESGKEIPDTHEPEKDIPENNEPETGAPEETVPEKPQADRELEAGDDLTITGELEGEHPQDYLIRFTPEKNQTMILVLTADKELKTTIKNENTGDGKTLVKDHTDEDGMMTWTVTDYRADKENTYLLRISAEKPVEFTLRLVRKSIYEQEQAAEETKEEPGEQPANETDEEPKDELADGAADAEPGKVPADEPAEQPGEESAEIPEEQPAEETTVDIQAEKDPDLPEMPETIGDDTTGEPEAEPEMEKPAADREITAGDDVTVNGEMNPSGEYLIRFAPDTDLTLYLILTAENAEATVTDEQTGNTKAFTPDSTVEAEQTVLTVPFYKAKTGNTYLIRISGTGAFTARLVRGSILKAEANRQDEPDEPEEAESDPSEETEENQAEEAAEEPAAESEAVPDEPETEQKTVSGATEEPETKPEQAEKAAPETQAEQAVPEATAEAEMPAIQTDLELAEEKTSATQTDLQPAEEEKPATWTDLEPVEIRIDATDSDIEAYILFLSDAGIPEGTELQIRELTPEEQEAYQVQTARALNAEDESYLRYTKYLEFTLVHDGWAIPLNAPVKVYVTLPDIGEGADALQVVRFDSLKPVLLDSERTENTVSFETEGFDVFGIGNALVPVTDHETELVKVEVLSFTEDAPVNLAEAEAPEVIEGLEVLGTFTIEDNTEATPEADSQEVQDSLFIKAELKEDAELDAMEGVALYSVDEDGNTDILMEQLTEDAKITELEATQVAVIKDTGFRHLTLTVNPNETTDDQIVTLDGMMPKDAEAAVEDVTIAHAEANGMELSEENYPAEEETEEATQGEIAEETKDSEEEEQAEKQTEAEAEQEETEIVSEEPAEEAPETETEESAAEPETEGEETAEETGEELELQAHDKESEPEEEPKAKLIAAYNITILNGEEEYQPDEDKPITVEILDSRITINKNIELWHIKDDGTKEQVTEFTVEDGKITFEAKGFSVYELVDGPDPSAQSGWICISDVDTLATYVADKIAAGELAGLYMGHTDGYYFTSGTTVISTSPERKGITKTTPLFKSHPTSAAVEYYFEPQGNNQYKVYCLDSTENKQYIVQYGNSLKLGTEADGNILFTAKPNGSHIQMEGNDGYYWNMQGGAGGKSFAAWNKANDGNAKLDFWYHVTIDSDPFELDGNTYGFMYYNSSISGKGMMSTSTEPNTLDAVTLPVMLKTGASSDKIMISSEEDIAMWTFHWLGNDQYSLATNVNGTVKYLKIDGDKLTLSDTETAITVVAGSGDNANKIQLKTDESHVITLHYDEEDGTSYYQIGNKTTEPKAWLNLLDASQITDEYYITYSAMKVSVSDTVNVHTGSKIIIYTRRWNETKKAYEFFAIDHDGKLVPVTENGDVIQWVGKELNTLQWEFTEYIDEITQKPNFYYELQNTYSGLYLAPQITGGQVLSDQTIGINLDGRRFGGYTTTIQAWDDPQYDYAGIQTGYNSIVSGPMAQADEYYFAILNFSEPGKPTLVPTIDHEAIGLTMKIVDFSTQYNGANTSQEQAAVMDTLRESDQRKGLLETELGPDGYPIATRTGKSLSELYAGAKPVNHLFIQSVYEGSGYYFFDSSQNFAHLNGSNFEVYKELGTVSATSNTGTRKHGQFMPYNTLNLSKANSNNPMNLTDITGKELPEDSPRKYETLYGFNEAENYYFGMEIEGHFIQTPDGKDDWGHDIIFDFVGDDDFWLFVDGVLVLDIGGIHSAEAGSVNYSTGDVTNGAGGKKTLYDIFRANYAAQNGLGENDPAVLEYLDSVFEVRMINGQAKRIFKKYSAHDVRIFYMERGAGASNLRMRFNLATVTPGQVLLSKEITGTDKQAYSSAKFAYQIWYDDEDTQGMRTLKEFQDSETGKWNVVYHNSTTPVEYDESVEINESPYADVFYLKPGQTIEVNVPTTAIYYYIKECSVIDRFYDEVFFNGEAAEKVQVEDSEGSDYITTVARVDERAKVTFTNHVNPDALRTLTITKELKDAENNVLTAEQDPQTFQYRIRMGDELDYYRLAEYFVKSPGEQVQEGSTTVTKSYYCYFDSDLGTFVPTTYSDFDSIPAEYLDNSNSQHVIFKSSPNGSINRIPTGYSIEIRDLLVDTKFTVSEDVYTTPGYTLVGYERVDGSYNWQNEQQIVNEGIIKDQTDAKMVIHNKRGWGLSVEKKWTDDSFTESHDPIYVALFAGEDFVEGSLTEITDNNRTVYFYLSKLAEGKAFSDYVWHEVTVSSTTESGTTVTTVTPVGETATINAKPKGTDENKPFVYIVEDSKGTPTGSTNQLKNVRTDKVTNTRGGGIIMNLRYWDGELSDTNKGKALPGGKFTLKDSDGNDIADAVYTSDENGRITILYDFEPDKEYILTETASPRVSEEGGTQTAYQGLEYPVIISIDNSNVLTISYNGHTDNISQVVHQKVHENIQNDLIATITINNKPFTLQAIKVDGENGNTLSNATFELYKQVIGTAGPTKALTPMLGYENLTSANNGVIPKIIAMLPAGTYYLTEKDPPFAYRGLTEDIVFTISPLGTVTIQGEDYASCLSTVIGTNGTTAYTINVPNTKTGLVKPVISISKKVEGEFANKQQKFTFTISGYYTDSLVGLAGGAKYDYIRYTSTDGEHWTAITDTVNPLKLTAKTNGDIVVELRHYEKIIISMPVGCCVTVTETNNEYTASYIKRLASSTETSVSATLGNVVEDILLENDDSNVNIAFTNTLHAVAPTAFTSRHSPFVLLMIFGILSMTIGGIGFARKKKRLPDTGPAKAKVQSRKQRVETPPRPRGAPPSAPPCPRAGLWASPSGSTGKRGDPGL